MNQSRKCVLDHFARQRQLPGMASEPLLAATMLDLCHQLVRPAFLDTAP